MSPRHKNLAAWYLQLAQHLEAGLPFASALRFSSTTGLPTAKTEAAAQVIESGGSVEDAFRFLGGYLPPADQRFLSTAAETGRLPRVLHNLAVRHTQYSSVKTRLVLACLYPLAILHIGLFVFPALRMINWEKGFLWDPFTYLCTIAALIVPLWSALLLLYFLSRRQSPLLGRLGRGLPIFHGYLKAQSLADFSFALGNFLDAGLSIDRAWSSAGLITRSPLLAKAAREATARIERGEAPGPQLSAFSCFPDDFVALYRAGESTGQLERNLLHLASLNQERANHQLKLATMIYPSLLFLLVVGIIAYHVISFYAGYFKMLSDLADK